MSEFSGKIGHLENVSWPWANAGGVVKTMEDIIAMAQTGVGYIEAGSYTLEPRLGNAWNAETGQPDKTVYDHNTDTGVTANSLGMPNKGMDRLEEELREMLVTARANGTELVVNVAPVTDDPLAESAELLRRVFSKGIYAVILNAGCPNVISEDGSRHELLSRNPVVFSRVVRGLAELELPYPIWVRISPQESLKATETICRSMIDSGIVSAVLTPNTWPGYVPLDVSGKPVLEVPGGAGGKSGPAVADEAAQQTAWAIEALKGSKIDVISSSGITNARELQRRLDLGAVAGAGTTFYYEAHRGWREETDRLLSELTA